MSSRVVYFELPADDPDRCAQFYADAFGWAIQKWGGPTDLDVAGDKVVASGGSITNAKHAVPGVGWLAYATDTEGNPFGMLQVDESAA